MRRRGPVASALDDARMVALARALDGEPRHSIATIRTALRSREWYRLRRGLAATVAVLGRN